MTARICSFIFVTGIGLAAALPVLAQEISLADSLLLMRADSATVDGRYGPAISMYRSFIARNPDAFGGRYGIARAFYYRGEPERALPFLNELVHDFPDEADPHVIRGYAYLQLGRIDPAIDDFLWVTSRFPDYSDAWAGLGLAYWRSDRMRRAAEVYDSWIRAEPERADAYVGRARVRAALGMDAAANADLELARQFGASASELRAIQEQVNTSDWNDKLQVATGYRFDSFGGRRQAWETYQAELGYHVRNRGAVLFEYTRETRHGLWDRAVRGEVHADLWTSAGLYAYWAHALDLAFLPANDVSLELSQALRDGWLGSALFRQMSFPSVRADFYGVGLEKYAGNWLIRTRFYLVDVRERTNPVIQAQIRYFIYSPDTFVALNVGYGQEVVAVDAIGTVLSISNAAIGAYLQTFFWDHVGLGVGVNYANTEILPNRGGMMFRLMSRL